MAKKNTLKYYILIIKKLLDIVIYCVILLIYFIVSVYINLIKILNKELIMVNSYSKYVKSYLELQLFREDESGHFF